MATQLKVEDVTVCAICDVPTDELYEVEEHDADLGKNEVPLKTKLLALSQNKVLPSGRICGRCVRRATDAWKFQEELKNSNREPSLSDKIRLLRQRLHELTQKIDVFIVIGPEKGDGQPVYTEDNIIMVDKNLLGDAADDDDEVTHNAKGERVYQCSVCPESFPKLSDYMEHSQQHPADSLHSCWTCGKQFVSRESLKTHAVAHRDIDQLMCHLCNQVFQGQVELKRHACEARCPACEDLLADRASLAAHVAAHHSRSAPAPPHVCPTCFQSFSGPDLLTAHLVKHRQTKQFVCGYDGCILRFATRNNLMTHIRKCHTEVASLRCSVSGCGVELCSAEELRRHALEAHSGCPCTVCKRVFGSAAALKKHMKVHTGKRGRKRRKPEPEDAPDTSADEAYHTVLIQQEQAGSEAEYAELEIPMETEYGEEEVEYLEVETLEEEEYEEVDLKPDLSLL